MTTIGKRFIQRTHDKSSPRIVDRRTRAVLDAVLSEKRGKALEAYLRATKDIALLLLPLLFPLLFASVAQARSGTLSGTVVTPGGEPLPFVNIVLEGTLMGTTTNKVGAFSFTGLADGEYTVLATMVGRQNGKVTTRIPGAVDLRIILEERVVDLPVFTVQNSMTGGAATARKEGGSAWYIGPKEIEQFAYTDVSRMLRSVPGVNIQEEDGFGLRPNIGLRGAGPERTSKITVMEDGILVAPAPYSAPAAYYFPTAGRMNAIEVVKGSSQVRFGPLTTGGAINFLSTPVPERTSGMVAAWGGSYGARNLHARAGTEVGQFGVLLETFQQASDGFKVLDNDGPTGFTKGDNLIKLNWHSKAAARVQHAVALKANTTRETSDETYLGLSRADFADTPFRRYAGSQFDRMDVDHDLLTAQYAISLPKGPKIVATLYRTNTYRNWYKLDQVVDSNGTRVDIAELLDRPGETANAFATVVGGDSEDDALRVKSNNRNYQTSGLQVIATHTIKREQAVHDLELGVRLHNDLMDRFQWTDGYRMQQGTMLRTSSGRAGTESNRVSSADALASHAMYDLQLGRWGVHPGIRHEHIVMAEDNYGTQDPDRSGSNLRTAENTVDVLIPGMSVDMDVTPTTMVFMGVHRGFSPPGTNPETRPENSVNYELGTRHQVRSLDLQVIAFFNDYSELLGSDMAAGGGDGSGDMFNGGQATVAGLEFFASYDPLMRRDLGIRLPITVGYTFTDARFGSSFQSTFEGWGSVVEGDRIPFIAEHQVNVRITLEGSQGNVSLNLNHMGAMASSAGPGAGDAQQQIPAFTVLDISGTYRLSKQMEVFGTVQNLADEVYMVSLVPAGARPGLPRTVQAGIRFRL